MTENKLAFPKVNKGRAAWLVRVAALAMLLAVMGMPVGEVYSSAFPTIRKLHIVGNDLQWIRGVAKPDQHVWLWIRQRNFKEDDHSPLNFNCPNNTDDWVQFSDLEPADANGDWMIDGLDLMVLPPAVGTKNCNAALLTEFIVGFGATESDVPILHMFNIPNGTVNSPQSWLEADIENANQVALSVTDGPDDSMDAVGGIDMDEDGLDLCAHPGFNCGDRITFRGSGGTFASPAIDENDASVFDITNPIIDNEYKYILSMAEAHNNGASLLAAAKTPRFNDHLGPAVNVNVNIKAAVDVDLCDSGFFSFF
jgi:hypothetical protein